MADANHENYQAPMLDVIDDTVITNPNSVSILANELLHAGWEWVVGELVDCNLNALWIGSGSLRSDIRAEDTNSME